MGDEALDVVSRELVVIKAYFMELCNCLSIAGEDVVLVEDEDIEDLDV